MHRKNFLALIPVVATLPLLGTASTPSSPTIKEAVVVGRKRRKKIDWLDFNGPQAKAFYDRTYSIAMPQIGIDNKVYGFFLDGPDNNGSFARLVTFDKNDQTMKVQVVPKGHDALFPGFAKFSASSPANANLEAYLRYYKMSV